MATVNTNIRRTRLKAIEIEAKTYTSHPHTTSHLPLPCIALPRNGTSKPSGAMKSNGEVRATAGPDMTHNHGATATNIRQ